MKLVQQRSNKTKILAILFIIIGIIIFISSFISLIQMSSYYIGEQYNSFFTFLLGVIFGKLGWGLHFGITLLIIGINFIKPLKVSIAYEGENHMISEPVLENKSNGMSVIEWFGTLVLVAIPIVNVIMLIIWSLGNDNEKKNFSLAYLLYTLIIIVISIAVAVFVTTQMYWY